MPTYEYRCPRGHEFELFQRISEEPVAKCPECGTKAERLLSAGAGLVFKGSGFYITDYRSDSYRDAARKEKKGDPGSKGTADGGGDSGSKGGSGSKGDAGGTASKEKKTDGGGAAGASGPGTED